MAQNTTPIQVIRQNAARFGLDPAAVLAYALTQGGTSWGAVGDHGTSFGPFQLHQGGALGSHTAGWANSPAGLVAAMGMMSRAGARGRKGAGAAAFINGPAFGRGANPAGDMAKARAAYPRAQQLIGQPASVAAPAAAPATSASASASAPVADGSRQLALALLFQSRAAQGMPVSPLLQQALVQAVARQTTQPSPAKPAASPAAAGAGRPGARSIPGYAVAQGVDIKDVNPALVDLAKQWGLDVTSGFRSVALQRKLYAQRSAPGSVAAPGKSFHNSGHAIDVAPNKQELALLAYAFKHPAQFREVFYDPAGRSIKNGKIVRWTIGGHKDHIHIAV